MAIEATVVTADGTEHHYTEADLLLGPSTARTSTAADVGTALLRLANNLTWSRFDSPIQDVVLTNYPSSCAVCHVRDGEEDTATLVHQPDNTYRCANAAACRARVCAAAPSPAPAATATKRCAVCGFDGRLIELSDGTYRCGTASSCAERVRAALRT